MSSTRSIIAPPPFAEDALTVIPPTPVAGVSYRDPTAGPASSPDGWPYAERVNSAEFNQIMFQLSSLLSILDKKGILGWSDLVDYTEFGLALGSDGVTYKWVSNSGPSNGGAQDPVTDTDNTYWDVAFIDKAALAASSTFANARGVSMSTPTATASASLTIPNAVFTVGPTGLAYKLNSLVKVINLGSVGAGGMDVGLAPVSGDVAVYGIYNPRGALSGTNPTTVARDVTGITATETYDGANMPADYTASVLLGVYKTNASRQFVAGTYQLGRKVTLDPIQVLSGVLNTPTFTSMSIAAAVPYAAKFASLTMQSQSTAAGLAIFQIASTSSGAGARQVSGSSVTQIGAPAPDVALITPQTVWRINNVSAGTTAFQSFVVDYTF